MSEDICAGRARPSAQSCLLYRRVIRVPGAVLCGGVTFSGLILAAIGGGTPEAQTFLFKNENGKSGTISSTGVLDESGPFFRSLGTNGRTCATCHQASDNWSVSATHIRERFEATQGLDPIFRTNDGSNCDTATASTVEDRRNAYSLLLNKGLIRVSLSQPADAEFEVSTVVNPYGCDSKSLLSVYRRPLPATNLRFLTAVMWDARESFSGNTLEQNLAHQVIDATLGHAAAVDAPSDDLVKDIVDFEMSLTTAQAIRKQAGALDSNGGRGGPLNLSSQPFFVGINDPLGTSAFNPSAFTLFPDWKRTAGNSLRGSISRGENIFNTRPIQIQGVAGLNDQLNLPVIAGTCTTCHNTPNVGNHSVPLAVNIGIADASRHTPDLPLFFLTKKATGEVISTSDPGRALITGKWQDIGKTKGPVLRGLSGRAPYFHNGSAATLADVVDFYDTRFLLGLTPDEKTDLANFLSAL